MTSTTRSTSHPSATVVARRASASAFAVLLALGQACEPGSDPHEQAWVPEPAAEGPRDKEPIPRPGSEARTPVEGTDLEPADHAVETPSEPCKVVAGGAYVCLQSDDPFPEVSGDTVGVVPPPPGGSPNQGMLRAGGVVSGDQGACGSCVAFAVWRAIETWIVEHGGTATRLSENHCWAIGGYGSSDCDPGSRIDVVVEAQRVAPTFVVAQGVWPYDAADPWQGLDTRPDDLTGGVAYIRASHSIGSNPVGEIENAIAQGWPVVISVRVCWEDGWQNGPAITDDTCQNPGGRHAVTVIGYDRSQQTFTFINSWGNGWGSGGRGTLSYDAVDALSNGGMAIVSVETQSAPPEMHDRRRLRRRRRVPRRL